MRLDRLFLFLFIICCLLCLTAFIINDQNLFLIAKTMIFPTITFYYFDLVKKINYLFVFALFLFYLADIFILLDTLYMTFALAIILNISHLLILKLAIQDIKFPIKKDKLFWSSVLFLFFVQSLQIPIFILMRDSNFVLGLFIFVTNIVLSTTCGIAFYNYFLKKSSASLYFLITCVLFVILYLAFYIYKYIYFVAFLKYLSMIFKLASYFFIVKYMISKDKFLIEN